MEEQQFAPGFRFSMRDLAVILIAGVAAAAATSIDGSIGMVIAFVVGHFFLFCNVFRISRPLELVWAAVFVGLGAATTLTSTPGWPLTFLLSLILTCIVVALEMRKPSYHGLFWRRINPRLQEWWNQRPK